MNHEAYPTISVAVKRIYTDGGVSAFYAGLSPTLIGMLPYSTCYYFMYETIKCSYCQEKKKKALNRTEMLLVGALSGKAFIHSSLISCAVFDAVYAVCIPV